ncbi:MAG: ABC transporter permease [Planctomycetota bacterium]
MSGFKELRELTRIRILSFLREPEAVFWVFAFPVVLAAVLGFAFRSAAPEPVRVGVIEGDSATELVEAFEADEYLETETFETYDEAFVQLRKAAVDVLVSPPTQPDAPPKLSLDPTRTQGETAKLRVLRAIRLARANGDGSQADPEHEIEPITERGSRYVDFLYPGLIGMNLMGTGMWGIGFAIADFRRRKFLKRLLVTPMNKGNFLASFMMSRLVFLALELGVLIVFGLLVLSVPLRGDLVSFALISIIGATMFAGIGLLTAARAQTIEGVSGLMNLVMVPMWLGSGVFFSYERFPDWLHPMLQLLPLTALNDALRASMIDGASVLDLGKELGVMAAWTAIAFGVALRIFRWN